MRLVRGAPRHAWLNSDVNNPYLGAGPAGLEAARVSAERGHAVTVFEAADQPGGQIRIAAGLPRRREILGIVDWRVQQCEKKGVLLRLNTYAEAEDVLAEASEVVVVATGGVPDTSFLDAGEDLVTSGWDLLTGGVRVAENVIFYDDNGAHPGMTAAEFVAENGAQLEIITPERTLAPDVGGTNYPAYFRSFAKNGARITINLRLRRVRREGNALIATFFDDYSKTYTEKSADQIVVEHGTTPMDELYFSLKPRSWNLGEVDYASLLGQKSQAVDNNPDGSFLLYRIGDAIASRNIHAAVYDALRLAKDF